MTKSNSNEKIKAISPQTNEGSKKLDRDIEDLTTIKGDGAELDKKCESGAKLDEISQLEESPISCTKRVGISNS